jgi:hypothetical protein
MEWTAMKKGLAVRIADREDLAQLPEQVPLEVTGVAAARGRACWPLSVAVGLRVMSELLQAELEAKVGLRGRHDP